MASDELFIVFFFSFFVITTCVGRVSSNNDRNATYAFFAEARKGQPRN